MIIPVTSTKVETNGALEVAGSNPSRLNNKGSIAPTRLPHRTTPTNETPIASPTTGQ
jgi:hypothetical protein